MTHTQGQFYPRVFALIATALLGHAVFGILQPFLGPVVVALVLALLRFAEESRGEAAST